MRKDHLHLKARRVDSYNKPFNFYISMREPGKSTVVLNRAIKEFRNKGRASIILRRMVVDITETYINDIETAINKFQTKEHKIKLEFKKGDIREGVVNVYIKGKLFLRVIALSIPKSRFKSTVIRNPGIMIVDEFICDNRHGEKYLNDESGKFKEIYNTYQRECNGYVLKVYFCGNPYSLFNPYFVWLGVDTSLLVEGALIVGSNYCIYCYRMKKELKELILKRNPLYSIKDEYTEYAFNGKAVNDTNFQVVLKQPNGYYLRHVIRINNKYVGIYKNESSYWVTILKNTNRKVIAIDFNNLCENSNLITPSNRIILYALKDSISRRKVSYSSIEAGYLMEEIYYSI